MRRVALGALLAAWGCVSAGGSEAQSAVSATRAERLRVSNAVAPETVTVGDRFRSVIQVVAPAGATVEFSPLPVGDTLQPVDSVRVIPGKAGEPPTAAYTLAAWVAGVPLQAQVSVRIQLPDGQASTYLLPLRLPVVRSVLPADTSGITPRPARGLLALPRSERTWPWLLLLIPLAALAVAWLLLRRRGSKPEGLTTPRERALAALRQVVCEHDRGSDHGVVYPSATRVLRTYLAETGSRWGSDLTSQELLQRLSEDSEGPESTGQLAALLEHADRVKFARYQPSADEARRFLAGLREWIESYPADAVAGAVQREAA